MRFYLTTHKRHWLRLTSVPLFLKSEHFDHAIKWDEARGPYAVDSGGFMELKDKGAWTRPPRQYVDDLRRIWEHVGPYDWAAQQDWMCEDAIIHGGTFNGQHFVGTHLSVIEHQRRTVANFLELRSLALSCGSFRYFRPDDPGLRALPGDVRAGRGRPSL